LGLLPFVNQIGIGSSFHGSCRRSVRSHCASKSGMSESWIGSPSMKRPPLTSVCEIGMRSFSQIAVKSAGSGA
jgi:hypothetical protein